MIFIFERMNPHQAKKSHEPQPTGWSCRDQYILFPFIWILSYSLRSFFRLCGMLNSPYRPNPFVSLAAPTFAVQGNIANTTFSAESTSLEWQPPTFAERNGIITSYNVLYQQHSYVEEIVAESPVQSTRVNITDHNAMVEITLQSLIPASVYTVVVQACVGGLCSGNSSVFNFTTDESSKNSFGYCSWAPYW